MLISFRPVDVGLTENWDSGFGDFLEKSYQNHPRNLDHNSGNPLGVSVCQLSTRGNHRVTASGAYLATTPPNLTIMTEAAVTRVIFQEKKAIGVEIPGKKSRRILRI